ncbi:MAG: hypothetical protein ABSB74_02355 [Tepidisphaeraceae bacterium]
MRLTFVIVTVIFTALIIYAKLMSMAREPADSVRWHDDGHWPASIVHAPIIPPKSP